MDPVLVAALAEFLAANCSGTIQLSCGAGGNRGVQTAAVSSPRQCPSAVGQCRCPTSVEPDCPTYCPEADYSDPDQPYFWEHTTMRLN